MSRCDGDSDVGRVAFLIAVVFAVWVGLTMLAAIFG